jgi:hypothetical protein
MEDIHDIRPPVEVGFDPNILITIGWILGAILVFLLIFYFIKKWLKNRKKPSDQKIVQPLIPPFEAAMKKIDLLMKKDRVDLRVFYFDLTAIFKDYIGKSFKFHAIEMTSQEFVKQLNQINLDINVKSEIVRFQTQTDPIKYAGTIPQKKQVGNDIVTIKSLIEEIETYQIKERQNERDRIEQNQKVQNKRDQNQITKEAL